MFPSALPAGLRLALPTVLLLALTAIGARASSVGELSNFDVVNDTQGPCHGFEIELEDIHPNDVLYTFGGTYTRYGEPEVVDTTVDPGHPVVVVRYRHWTGSAWAETPVAPPNVTPGGHDCFSGGPIGNYEASGCEHYGVSLNASPTRTSYRWLVAVDPADMNSTFTTVPQPVNLPVPVWNVIPPPVGGGPVKVRAELDPVEEVRPDQFGEPQWLKVFKIESELDLKPEDLVKLLLGVPDSILPGETEIETEWKLIQSRPGNEKDKDADVREDPLDAGKRSVIRRYELYVYTGPRDPENNEALPCIGDDAPVPVDAPVNGCSDLGSFSGAQNVAIDVEGIGPEPTATETPPPTAAATPTTTGTAPATVTPTAMASPTATSTAVPAGCAGDCRADGTVTVDELITLVNVALEIQPATACASLPPLTTVDVAYLVRAVGNALNGCG